jgi:hypothetical protein
MAHKKKSAETIRNEVNEAYAELENGLQELMTSEKYLDFLNTMAERPRYSFNNTVLVYLQKPDATFLAGYGKFRETYGHQVIQGEKGIKIFAPIIRKKKNNLIEGEIEKSKDNKEEKEEETIVGFRMVKIFDISQTKPIMEKTEEGNEIPCKKAQKLIDSLSYLKMVNLWAEDEEFQEELLAAAKDMIDIPVKEKELSPDLGGYFRFQDKDNLHIVLNNKFGITSRFTTLLHEWTHYHLHNPFKKETEWITEKFKKQDKEIQAESVAYIVAKHFGIDSSPESFKYVASWSKEKDIKDLKISMEIIQKTAATFIELIETRLETEGFALKIHA